MVGPEDNMPPETTEKDARMSDTAAEAAVWMARLKSDQRLPETESAFRHWLATTPNAQGLFDDATEVWEMIPSAVQVRSAPAFYQSMSRRVAVVVAIAAVFVLVIFGGFFVTNARPIVYETQTGEQRTLALADGSKVTLNTDTRLSVTYSRNRRYIQFNHGEAIFQVAHDTTRPFVVETGTQRVTALGTVFLVRSDPSAMQVALFSGKVELVSKDNAATPSGMILKPGERATVRVGLSPIVDRPSSEVITAWQRQEIVFSDVTLSEAINELNRYSRLQIVVADSGIASLKVAGVFQTGDSEAFAKNIARIYGLKIRQSENLIELTH